MNLDSPWLPSEAGLPHLPWFGIVYVWRDLGSTDGDGALGGGKGDPNAADGPIHTSLPLHNRDHLFFPHVLRSIPIKDPSDGARMRGMGLPVFIITCVVARLTFFLKPFMHHVSHDPGRWTESGDLKATLPAQDMVIVWREFMMRMSGRCGWIGGNSFDDGG
jgi:hypothetical protein